MSLKTVRALLICTLVQIGSVFFVLPAKGQQQTGQPRTTSELGIGIGGVVYKGEIAPRYRLRSNRPALNLFYRKDVSNALAWKVGLLIGRVKAEDEDFTDNPSFLAKELPLSMYRQATVKTSFLELSAALDYNFMDYYDFRRNLRWTPYFTVGVAGLVYNNKTTAKDPKIIYPENTDNEQTYRTAFALAIPVGVGAKFALSEHWNLGFDAGVRVLLTDDFDNLTDQNEKVMNPNSRDLYFYNGVSLSYTFYKINCPIGSGKNGKGK
ncbi:DUF6089 family protein [Rufibacter sediminis]|uniref:Outer membrane beta-barrel protein n=1 Tax=Rufibacter sediminis TaxID=2762756 RepID=A0ABR6VVI4_9BACT|nr:DUF6089 family protein [Rufibacter sediminis]MBC3540818.1 outer membrane beta-barrel protein [Rufibacter sediminis]